MTGLTAEGQLRRIEWEVCPVRRPLLSVARMTRTGNVLQFAADKAFIKNVQSGQITQLRKERNVWMLDLWIPREKDLAAGFARQGSR